MIIKEDYLNYTAVNAALPHLHPTGYSVSPQPCLPTEIFGISTVEEIMQSVLDYLNQTSALLCTCFLFP